MKIVFSRIDDLPLGSRLDIDDALRRANPDTPPDVDTTPEPVPDEIIDGETPGQTTRADAPENRETPDADNDTSNVPEDNRTDNMRVGDLAEADAARRLDAAGYDTYSIKNSSGHGTDIIAVNRTTGEIRVIEVKSRGSDLRNLQRDGGYDDSNDVLRRFNEDGNRTWTDEGFLQQLRGLGYDRNTWTSDPRVNYEVWSYQDADLATGNAGTPVGPRGHRQGLRMVNRDYGFKSMLIRVNCCAIGREHIQTHQRKTDARPEKSSARS